MRKTIWDKWHINCAQNDDGNSGSDSSNVGGGDGGNNKQGKRSRRSRRMAAFAGSAYNTIDGNDASCRVEPKRWCVDRGKFLVRRRQEQTISQMIHPTCSDNSIVFTPTHSGKQRLECRRLAFQSTHRASRSTMTRHCRASAILFWFKFITKREDVENAMAFASIGANDQTSDNRLLFQHCHICDSSSFEEQLSRAKVYWISVNFKRCWCILSPNEYCASLLTTDYYFEVISQAACANRARCTKI